jgi:hypothetical protein
VYVCVHVCVCVCVCVRVCVCVFETLSHCVAQIHLELMILLPYPPESWVWFKILTRYSEKLKLGIFRKVIFRLLC